ncbi:MAG: hypothetical protein KatS3mg113_0610 [Planctomycetaceae bacterium]|nr:MAG: hypothetical protein KatS3mg113_0610 [Planctomycetaceae bacterium]
MRRLVKQCGLCLWLCVGMTGLGWGQTDPSSGSARVSDIPGPLPPVADQVYVPGSSGPPGPPLINQLDPFVMPRVFFDARGGTLYGYQDGFTQVGVFTPFMLEENSLLFIDGRGLVNYDGRGGANVGLGWRGYFEEIDRIFGFAAWYDFDAGHAREYHQIALSLESLGRYFDLRMNGYIPVGQDQYTLWSALTGEMNFVGHQLLVTRATSLETAYAGFDTEIGGPMPILGRYGLSGYVGFYFYTSSSADADFTGVSGRLTWQVNENMTIGVQMTDDHAFGTNTQIQVAMTLPDGMPSRWLRQLPVRDRLFQNVIRNYRVTAEREIKFGVEPAINPRDGLPYFIVHVDPNVNGPGVPAGDGTYENPYNLLAQFDGLPLPDKSQVDIIWVRPRNDGTSINLNNGVTLLSGQRLLSTTLSHVVQVAQQPGTPFIMPAITQNLGALPVLSNTSGGNVVTFGTNEVEMEVSGFVINGSATGSGIAGINNQAVNINRNAILNGLTGISLQNLTGLAATDMQSVIDRNIIRNNVGDGISIINTGAAPLDLIVSNNPALDVDLDGDSVPDSLDGDGNFNNDGIVLNGGDGLDIRANAGSIITLQLQDNRINQNNQHGARLSAATGGTIGGLIAENQFHDNTLDGLHITANAATADFLTPASFLTTAGITQNTFLRNGSDGLELNMLNSTLNVNVTANLFGDRNVAGSQNAGWGVNYIGDGGNTVILIGGPNAADGNSFFANVTGGINYTLLNNNVTTTNIENNVIALVVLAPGTSVLRDGFNDFVLTANDDGSTGAVPLGFLMNYFGTNFANLFVNNNGNVTFTAPTGQFTPTPLATIPLAMVAPFLADVDTRLGAEVTYGTEVIDGHNAFGVSWIGVRHNDVNGTNQGLPTNSFQVVFIDRSDIAPGDFDLEFNYGQIQWESGQKSGGNAFGLGGVAARAGFTNGTGTAFELPGSGINGAFLDSGPATTSLVNNSLNSPLDGRYVFFGRSGTILTTPSTTLGSQDGIRITVNNSAQLVNSTIQNNIVTGNSGYGLSITTNNLGVVNNMLIQNNEFNNNGAGVLLRRTGSSTFDVQLSSNEMNQNNTNGLQIEGFGTALNGMTVTMQNNQLDRNGLDGMSISTGGSAQVTINSSNDSFTNSGSDNISVFTTDNSVLNLALDEFVATGAAADGLHAEIMGNSTFIINLFNDPLVAVRGFNANGGDGFSVATGENGLALVTLDGLSFNDNGGDGIVFDRSHASLLLATVLNSTVTGNGDDGIQFYTAGASIYDPNTPLFNPVPNRAPANQLDIFNTVVENNGTLGAAAPNGGNGFEVATLMDSFLVVNATQSSFSLNATDGVRIFSGMSSSFGDKDLNIRSIFDGVTMSQNGRDGLRIFVQGLNSSVPTALLEINSVSAQTLIQDNADDGVEGSVIYGNLDILVQSGGPDRTFIQRNGATTIQDGHGIEFNVGGGAFDNDDTTGANSVAQFFFPNQAPLDTFQVTQPAGQPILAVGNLTVLDAVVGDENLTDAIGNGNAGDGIHVFGSILDDSIADNNFNTVIGYTERFLAGAPGGGSVAITANPLPISQANVLIDNSDVSNNGRHGINFLGRSGESYEMANSGRGFGNNYFEANPGSSTTASDLITPSVQFIASVTNSRIEQNFDNGINIDLRGRYGQHSAFFTNSRQFINSFFIDNNVIQRNGIHGLFFESNAGAQHFVRVDFQGPQPTTPATPYDPADIAASNPFLYNSGQFAPVILDDYLNITTDANTQMVFTRNTVQFNGGRIPGVGEGMFVRVSTNSYLALDLGGAAGSGLGNIFSGNTLADVRFESFIAYQEIPGGIRLIEQPPDSVPNTAPTADQVFLDHTAQLDLRFANNIGSEVSAPFAFAPDQAAIYPGPDVPNGKDGVASFPRAVQIFQVDDGLNLDAINLWPLQILPNEFSNGNFHLRNVADPLFPNVSFPQNYFNNPGNPFLP